MPTLDVYAVVLLALLLLAPLAVVLGFYLFAGLRPARVKRARPLARVRGAPGDTATDHPALLPETDTGDEVPK
jgi:hypothetical protein